MGDSNVVLHGMGRGGGSHKKTKKGGGTRKLFQQQNHHVYIDIHRYLM